MTEPLSAKKKRFVEEYLTDYSIRGAAGRAGYSDPMSGYAVMRDFKVRQLIDIRREVYRRQLAVTAETVISAIAARAFFDPASIAVMDIRKPSDLMRLTDQDRTAIDGWKWDADGNFIMLFADRGKALDQLARHLALYKDKLEVEFVDGLTDRITRARQRLELPPPEVPPQVH